MVFHSTTRAAIFSSRRRSVSNCATRRDDRTGMRDNWLSNRVFTGHDDIVGHCCFYWNRLIEMPWRIMSIGLRDWAHQF